MTLDPYASDTHRWWHLSSPPPELRRALDERWLAPPGRALDIGCGLGTEAGYLASAGFMAAGVDLSDVALHRGRVTHAAVAFARADALYLPFRAGTFDALVDRGCFHYLSTQQRPAYAAEARRVLRPAGRLLLRACLYAAGVRNDIDEAALRDTFGGWSFLRLERGDIPSDTRTMPALIAVLERDPGAYATEDQSR